jgi:hypothetical protein
MEEKIFIGIQNALCVLLRCTDWRHRDNGGAFRDSGVRGDALALYQEITVRPAHMIGTFLQAETQQRCRPEL